MKSPSNRSDKPVREVSQLTYLGDVIGSYYIFHDGTAEAIIFEKFSHFFETVKNNFQSYAYITVMVWED
jgi:hypothetical protein